MLPYAVSFEPYTAPHVLTQLQLLLFSGLAFFLMLPYLKRTLTITLDADWLWRRLLPAAWAGLEALNGAGRRAAESTAGILGRDLLAALNRHAGEEARLARTWPVRRMALSVLVVLLGYLMLYYL
jgi:multicomponent Na+:H+ antiporter subunit D